MPVVPPKVTFAFVMVDIDHMGGLAVCEIAKHHAESAVIVILQLPGVAHAAVVGLLVNDALQLAKSNNEFGTAILTEHNASLKNIPSTGILPYIWFATSAHKSIFVAGIAIIKFSH
jgi:hypothetical protein